MYVLKADWEKVKMIYEENKDLFEQASLNTKVDMLVSVFSACFYSLDLNRANSIFEKIQNYKNTIETVKTIHRIRMCEIIKYFYERQYDRAVKEAEEFVKEILGDPLFSDLVAFSYLITGLSFFKQNDKKGAERYLLLSLHVARHIHDAEHELLSALFIKEIFPDKIRYIRQNIKKIKKIIGKDAFEKYQRFVEYILNM